MSLAKAAFIAYVLLAVGGFCLLLLRRLPLLFSLAFVSTLAYSIPVFFGFAMYPAAGGIFTAVRLEAGVYVVNAFVLALILCAGVWAGTGKPRALAPERLKGVWLAGWPALALALGLLAHAVLTGGSDLFSEDKLAVLKATGRSYSIGMISAFVAVAFGTEMRDRKVLVMAFVVLAFDLYIGFRGWIVMAMCVAGVLYLSDRSAGARVRRVSWKVVAVLVVAILCALFYKNVIPDMKAGRFDVALAKLADLDFYATSVVEGESFIVQAVLNEVLRTDYSVSGEHLLNLGLLLLAYTPELGFHTKFFNDQFQEDLFPETSTFMGISGNFWAEGYSVGGTIGVVVYACLYIAGLWLGTKLLSSGSRLTRTTSACIFVPWAFYIHRNELIVQLNLERQILVIVVSAVFGSMLLSEVISALKRPLGPAVKSARFHDNRS